MKIRDLDIYLVPSGDDKRNLALELDDNRHLQCPDVLADEEEFNDECPLWFTECEHVISPVYWACCLRKALEERFPEFKFSAVVRLPYNVINEEDMREIWDELGVQVYDNVRPADLPQRLEESEAESGYAFLREEAERLLDEWTPRPGIAYGSNTDALQYEDKGVRIAEPPFPTFRHIMKETGMDQLVGMDSIKAELENIYSVCRLKRMREKKGVKAGSEWLDRIHFILSGNPGTGKTTVARMLGKMLKRMGILSRGEVCVHSRTDLVQRYIGATEEHMMQIFDNERGNVLFIDEAYALFDGRNDRGDFGNMVLQSLLPILTEPNPNIVIVLAGYPDEMNLMLDSNPGLRSRFPFHLTFEDYSAEALVQIGMKKFASYGFYCDDTVSALFASLLEQHWHERDKKHFANARWADNIVYCIVMAAARRLSHLPSSKLSQKVLCRLTQEDILTGFDSFKKRQQPEPVKRKIGFGYMRGGL